MSSSLSFKAVYNLLNLVLRKGHLVGLVAFSHRVTVLANLTETNDEGKAMLLGCLPQPDRVGGGTSIAKGNQKYDIVFH